MNDPRTILHRATGSAPPSHYGLPPDLLAKARARVARLAGVLGALSLVAILLNATMFREYVHSVVQPQHLLAVVLSLVVILVARSRRIADTVALNVGLVYEVFLCWIVSFAAHHADVVLFGRPPEITWTSMIIVVFPMIVPLPPRRLLAASILGAISSPVSLFVLHRMGKFTLTVDELVGVSISPAFAVVLAYFGARMIYAISLDVSRVRLLGAYQLESRIGAGGMGEVWRASHRMLARPAAIKLIAPGQLGEDAHAVLARFEQEAQATALLRSPHTVEIYDFGRADDGSFYYVMELLDGVDLQELVRTHGPLPAPRVVHILRQACHSLDEAHAAGLVHRDIKPANLFVCRYGSDFDFVKVLDFGLVKHETAPEEIDPDLTREGSLIGTPAYLCPEAITGKSPIDHRSDLYSLGCVAYWLLTGELVFAAKTSMGMLTEHAKSQPIPPSQRSELVIPEALDRVVLACLAKDPTDRPEGAQELAARLKRIGLEKPWDNGLARAWWELHRGK
ncbi:MAG: hypothetical protein DHS20C21_09560 [Gemmatimonadota bacterium]|nr:MAG: hypothetical protein DHS20C21_09560 [Gemmatimonadota bacterium]